MELVLDPEPMYFTTKLHWFNTVTSVNSTHQYPTQLRVTMLETPIELCVVLVRPLCLCLTYLPSIFFLPLPSEPQDFSWVTQTLASSKGGTGSKSLQFLTLLF